MDHPRAEDIMNLVVAESKEGNGILLISAPSLFFSCINVTLRALKHGALVEY